MMYTKQQLTTISGAVCSISTYTNAALYWLDEFMETYLESKDSVSSLISMLEINSDRIYVELFAVKQLIREAKLELDAYSGDNSYMLRCYLAEAKERQEILNALSDKVV